MDIKALLEEMIVEFSSKFYQESAKIEDIELRIYCNFWKKDMLDALQLHDFESFPLPCENLANWFIRYAYALCEDPTKRNGRESLRMCNTLHNFPPRPAFMNTMGQKSPRRDLHRICNRIGPNAQESILRQGNIIENFQLVLEIEDVEIMLDYLQLVQRDVQLTKCAPFHYRARIQQLSNGRYVQELVSPKVDEVVIIPKGAPISFDINSVDDCIRALIPREFEICKLPVATVKDITEYEVTVETNTTKKICSDTVHLIFRPTRYPLRYQYRGLTLLDENEGMRKFLFPDKNLIKPEVADHNNNFLVKQTLINQKIAENPEQWAAVSQITSGRIATNAPFIIFGPPGTGKTTTIVESILQLRLQQPDSRILVTAGSNSACDTIALRICEYFKSRRCLENYAKNATVLPMLRIYSKSIIDRGVHNLPKDLRQYSNIEWVNGEHAYPAIEDIHRHGIIIATLCSVGKLVCGNVSSEGFFTHVFIDEAGAASEPETLVGIMGIKNEINDRCRVILSGDHKQLGPVIKSDHAVKLGLGKSLMQRLLERECYAVYKNGEYDRSLQIRLRRNYRSHPKIVDVYNRLYYGKELIAMAPKNESTKIKWSFLRNSDFPIAFHAVCGEMTKNGTTSSCNMHEVQIVISYICLLLRADRVRQSDIGVITPYRLQSDCIKSRLNEQNLRDVEVGSVENFQGREKPIVIASMVRSKNGLGFVKNRKRLNVLLSRPKILLLILGEPRTLSGFGDMKFVIDSCKRQGNYFDETNNTFGEMFLNKSEQKSTTKKKKSKPKKNVKKNSTKYKLKTLSETSSNLPSTSSAVKKPKPKKKVKKNSTKNKLKALSEASSNLPSTSTAVKKPNENGGNFQSTTKPKTSIKAAIKKRKSARKMKTIKSSTPTTATSLTPTSSSLNSISMTGIENKAQCSNLLAKKSLTMQNEQLLSLINKTKLMKI